MLRFEWDAATSTVPLFAGVDLIIQLSYHEGLASADSVSSAPSDLN